nr:uncharacterized protein CG3556 isoform X2 [Parasteatoda tepidariorum]
MKVAQFDLRTEDICQTTISYEHYYRTTGQPYFDNRRAILTIEDEFNNFNYTFYPSKFNWDQTITIRGDARITLEVNNQYNWCIAHEVAFRLEFSKVTGIETVEGIKEARIKVFNRMLKQLLPPLKWHDDIDKAVIALHLGGVLNFSKSRVFEELLIKQVDLKSSVALLRNKSEAVTLNKLAKIINSLLVTCHNPRKFYGYDLIKMAKEKLDEPLMIRSPLAYIALCNANETLSYLEVDKLLWSVREHQVNEEYPFSSDISALGLMALSCVRNQSFKIKGAFKEDFDFLYNETLEHLKMQQQTDGSFGNIYSTAIFTQALMSSNSANQSNVSDSVFPAARFLINHLNTSDFGSMAAYYILPILNGKTLLDIRYTDCSRNPRKDRDGSGISDIVEAMIKVQYSLIIGDKEDIKNTLSLRVPENITAYEIMQKAQNIESKYKFEWKRISGKMYVYEIAGIPVDPEEGRFWLTYYKNNTSTALILVPEGPDNLQLHDGYHLIQWYQSVHF